MGLYMFRFGFTVYLLTEWEMFVVLYRECLIALLLCVAGGRFVAGTCGRETFASGLCVAESGVDVGEAVWFC
jgi:hypothetical protein